MMPLIECVSARTKTQVAYEPLSSKLPPTSSLQAFELSWVAWPELL